MARNRPSSSATHLWLVLMKAHRSLARHAKLSLESEDLGLSDFVVLEMLLNKGPQRVSDIGNSVGLTSGAITTAVDRVARSGLVSRTLDPNDRRVRIASLTEKGEALITQLFERHVQRMERAASGLDEANRATLVALLKKLGLASDRLLAEGDAR